MRSKTGNAAGDLAGGVAGSVAARGLEPARGAVSQYRAVVDAALLGRTGSGGAVGYNAQPGGPRLVRP